MLKNLSLSISLLLWVNVLFAQNALDRFTAQQVNNEVLLNWTIKSGFTCNGIEILSSSDSLNFTNIGKIEGICGAVDEPISYTFSHKAPAQNKINYYRLELGGVGSTEIISVE